MVAHTWLTVAVLAVSLSGALAAFGCSSTEIDDQARSLFLNMHNDARLNMAMGSEPNDCGNMTSGKNVYKVSWDCSLEDKAIAHLATCPTGRSNLPSLGENFQYYSGSAFPTPLTTVATTLESWWGQGRAAGVVGPDNLYTGSPMFSFSNMAHGKLTGIGCAYKVCAGSPAKLTVMCLYNTIGYYTSSIIYESGPPCSADADCTTHPASTCDGGLCFKALEVADDGANTQCPTNPDMTDAARAKFLDMHNYLRSRGARGLEADFSGGNAPTASKMLKMEYDCDLELNAQAWSDNCVWAHSAPAQRVLGGVQSGENMWYTTALNFDKVTGAQQASQAWWDELKDFGVGPENNLTSEVFGRGVGHYTQMAWDDTYKLGCGITHCADKTFGVCQYNPTGNYLNNLIYDLGAPCSACPSGSTCDPAEGLCVL